MKKRKVSVFVAGQKFTIITEDSEKYVTDIASKVDTSINSLVIKSNMTRERCAVLTALDLCDDEAKARQALSELREQIKDYIQDAARLKKENEQLKEQIEILNREKERLSQSKKTMVATSSSVSSKQTDLKNQITSDSDLPFDRDAEALNTPQESSENKTDNDTQSHKQQKKSKHEHIHSNPYKQKFSNKDANEEKGYIPQRQYSLFDTKE